MSNEIIKVIVIDPSGSSEQMVGIPSSWTVERFIQEFLKKSNLPSTDEWGNSVPYYTVLKRTNELLDQQKTIQQAGIQEGDIIRLRVQSIGEKINKMNPRQHKRFEEYKNMVDLKKRSKGMLDFNVSNDYQHYNVTIKGIETFVNETTTREIHKFTIDLPPEYPIQPPNVKFEKTIFHPDWYSDGQVSFGKWVYGNKLSELVIDITKMMTFEIVNLISPANYSAKEWYLQNKEDIKKKISKVQFPPSSDMEFL